MSVKTIGAVTIASGFDEATAALGAGSSVVFGVISGLTVGGFRPVSLLVLGAATLLAAGSRYKLRLSPEGVVLTLYRGWFVPISRRRYMLDTNIELYPSEADHPAGMYLTPPLRYCATERASPPFGFHFTRPRLIKIHAAIRSALTRVRAEAPPPPRALRNALLAPHEGALDLEKAARDKRGRLREVASTAPIEIHGVTLPRGSLFYLNDEQMCDPRRDDDLREVVLAAPCQVYQWEARAGGRILFGQDGALSGLRNALPIEVLIDGDWVDGREVVSLAPGGRVSAFTLARSCVVAGLTIPAGSRFMRWPGDRFLPERWTVSLGGDLELPDVTLLRGDSIELSLSREEARAIAPLRDIPHGARIIRHGVAPIPLGRDLRIDIEKCEQMRIVQSARPAPRSPHLS